MSEHIIGEDAYSLITKFGPVRTVGEVVRCRNCELCEIEQDDSRIVRKCLRSGLMVRKNGFCAWAERRKS